MRFSIRDMIPNTRTRRQNAIYIALCIFFSLLIIAISVSVSFGLVVRDINYNSDHYDSGVNIDVELLGLDPMSGTLVVDIYPWFNPPNPDAYAHPNCSTSTTREFDIFLDQNLSAVGNPNWEDPENKDIPHSTEPNKASFQLTDDPCNYSFKQNVATFRKSLKLFLVQPQIHSRPDYGHIGSGLQAYPFDRYHAVLYLYATERTAGNSSQHIGVGEVGGVAPNFHTTFEIDFNGAEEGLLISFFIDRSVAIKVFCLTIVITNWVVSLVFLWITIACLFWKERVVKELFAIPISVLFAFSAVRGSMPGAPAGFGAFIDFVGILPNLAVLTVCSFILIFLILVERIKGSSPAEPGADANLASVSSKGRID